MSNAAKCWEMMSRHEDPMPAAVALDWLRETDGVEDTAELKTRLRSAAVASLDDWAIKNKVHGKRRERVSTQTCLKLLKKGNFSDALLQIGWIKREVPGRRHLRTEYHLYDRLVEKTVRLLEQLEELP